MDGVRAKACRRGNERNIFVLLERSDLAHALRRNTAAVTIRTAPPSNSSRGVRDVHLVGSTGAYGFDSVTGSPTSASKMSRSWNHQIVDDVHT